MRCESGYIVNLQGGYKNYEEECIRNLVKENLNKNINSLKESISLREENIRLKEQIDELEEEKSAIAWMGVILALMNNNNNNK